MGSVVIGDQRPGDWGAGLVVVPDGCGHGQDALRDPDRYSLEGPPGVGFEDGLAFEGVVDRLDQLADGLEQRLVVPGGLVRAGGPQQRDAAGGEIGFGLAAGEALVGDEDQAGPGAAGTEAAAQVTDGESDPPVLAVKAQQRQVYGARGGQRGDRFCSRCGRTAPGNRLGSGSSTTFRENTLRVFSRL